MTGAQMRALNDNEIKRTLRRIDGLVPLEMSEQTHLKHVRRQIYSRLYVSLTYFGIMTLIFSLTYLHILLGISSDLVYLLSRMSVALTFIVVMMWLYVTERITWKVWVIGWPVLFITCYLIA